VKGKNYIWNNLTDIEFLKIIGAIDKKTENLTIVNVKNFCSFLAKKYVGFWQRLCGGFLSPILLIKCS